MAQPDTSSMNREQKMISFTVPAQTNPHLLKLILEQRIQFQLVAVLPDSEDEDFSNRFLFTYVMHEEEGGRGACGCGGGGSTEG